MVLGSCKQACHAMAWDMLAACISVMMASVPVHQPLSALQVLAVTYSIVTPGMADVCCCVLCCVWVGVGRVGSSGVFFNTQTPDLCSCLV